MSERKQLITILSMIDTVRVSGPARGLLQLAKYLPEFGIKLHFVSISYDSGKDHEFALAVADAGATISIVNQRMRGDPGVLFEFDRIIRAVNPDVIQSHSYKTHALAFLFRHFVHRLSGRSRPWIAVEHGFTAESRRVALYNAMTRFLTRFADELVLVSATQAPEFKRKRPAHIIPNAVDGDAIPRRRSGPAVRAAHQVADDQVLGVVIGRLSREKGQALVIDAMARLRAQGSPALGRVRILLVGEGPDKDSLGSQIAAQNLGLDISLVPHTTAIGEYYEACDFLLLPSLSEGLPNVVLEAAAFGKAVLAADVGAVTSVLTHDYSGIVFRPGDVAAIAEGIERLAEDGSLRRKFGARAQAHVADAFAPRERARRFAELYRSVLMQ